MGKKRPLKSELQNIKETDKFSKNLKQKYHTNMHSQKKNIKTKKVIFIRVIFRPHFNSLSVIPNLVSFTTNTHNDHILCNVLFFIKPQKKNKTLMCSVQLQKDRITVTVPSHLQSKYYKFCADSTHQFLLTVMI